METPPPNAGHFPGSPQSRRHRNLTAGLFAVAVRTTTPEAQLLGHPGPCGTHGEFDGFIHRDGKPEYGCGSKMINIHIKTMGSSHSSSSTEHAQR